ncbi:EamA family transporter, partial [Lactobacillus equicursoris]
LWLGLAFVLILGTIVPFVWMNEALVHLSPAVVSLLDAFEPVASTIGSVLIFGLVLLPVDYIAIVLIIAATLAISMK